MKKLIFILILLLIACTAKEADHKQDVVILKNVSENQISVNIAPQPEEPEEKAAEELPQKETTRITSSNFTLEKNTIGKKTIRGTEHTIEVIDVSEDGKGCLISVDGISDLIDEGESKLINGIRVYVAEVYVLNSRLQDGDVCELVIA